MRAAGQEGSTSTLTFARSSMTSSGRDAWAVLHRLCMKSIYPPLSFGVL